MKTKIGAILLIILATLGFSETIAAQHVAEEEHSRRKTHGPAGNNAVISHLKMHSKSIKHRYNYFQKLMTKDHT
ncbi:hypothetical protein [Methanobacterium sp. MBAC-LM]|uniref:hypothetical protein n=1 Tax=Methanobacterium sp. MBAC-LM TaxID=3412034 RepID=UPI003C70F0BF